MFKVKISQVVLILIGSQMIVGLVVRAISCPAILTKTPLKFKVEYPPGSTEIKTQVFIILVDKAFHF